MSKTLLIIVGISAALLTAAGIMWHSSNSPRNQLIKQYNKFLLDSSGGKMEVFGVMREFRDSNNTINDAINILAYYKKSLPIIRKLIKDKNLFLLIQYFSINSSDKICEVGLSGETRRTIFGFLVSIVFSMELILSSALYLQESTSITETRRRLEFVLIRSCIGKLQ